MHLMPFISRLAIFVLLLFILLPIFLLIYGIYRAIRYRKTYILKMSVVLLGIMFCGMYYLYCYIDPINIAHYCIDKQCISIVETYKGGGVNAVSYFRIYDNKIYSRFQLGINNHIAILTPIGEMEPCICFSDKLVDNKFLIKVSSPVKINGNLHNVKLELDNYHLDNSDIAWHDLIYKYKRVKFRRLY